MIKLALDRNSIRCNNKGTMTQQPQQQQIYDATCYVLRDIPFTILCEKRGNLSNSQRLNH